MGCAICLEEYEDDNANPALQAVALRCGHIFHQKCIQDWLSSRLSARERCCAMCKAPSDFEQYVRSLEATGGAVSNEYIVLYPAEMEEIDKFLQQRNATIAKCKEIQRKRDAADMDAKGKGKAVEVMDYKAEEETLGLLLDFRMHINAFVTGFYHENASTVDFAALKLMDEVTQLKGAESGASLKLHKKLYERYQRTKRETERLRSTAAAHEAQLALRVQAATEHERQAHRKKHALDKREEEFKLRRTEVSLEAERVRGEGLALLQKQRALEEQFNEAKRMRLETLQVVALKEQRFKAECDEKLKAMRREVDEVREAGAQNLRARQHAEQERDVAVAKSLRLAKQLTPLAKSLEDMRRKKDEYKAAVETAKATLASEILALKKKLALASASSSSSRHKVAPSPASLDTSSSLFAQSLSRSARPLQRTKPSSSRADSGFNTTNDSSLIVDPEDISSEFNGISHAFRPPPLAVPRSALSHSTLPERSSKDATFSARKAAPSTSAKLVKPLKRVGSPSTAQVSSSSPKRGFLPPWQGAKPAAIRHLPSQPRQILHEAEAGPSSSSSPSKRRKVYEEEDDECIYTGSSPRRRPIGGAASPQPSFAPSDRQWPIFLDRILAEDRRRTGVMPLKARTPSPSGEEVRASEEKSKQRQLGSLYNAPTTSSSARSLAIDPSPMRDAASASNALANRAVSPHPNEAQAQDDAGLGKRAISGGRVVLGPKRKVRAAWSD